MEPAAYITIGVILVAMFFFISEKLSTDLVALLIIVALVLTGVISLEEGLDGFSNSATLTVAFMFVLSAAILKTGSMQYLASRLTRTFRNHYQRGVVLLMFFISSVSAFINNTPVVAVMIPVTLQIAKNSNRAASKLLIPISYASIFGGTCTLIGTSTNILVSGIAVQHGLAPFGMFDFTLMGICFLVAGSLFMIIFGQRLLPNREENKGGSLEMSTIAYLAEVEILTNSGLANKTILASPLVKELDMEILALQRDGTLISLPQGDTLMQVGDVLKVRCNIEKLKQLTDQLKVRVMPISGDAANEERGGGSFVELVIPANSELDGKTLREFDFRRRYRAAPLAIRHREEVLHDQLQEVRLRAGDVILVEMKNHYLEQWKTTSHDENPPFIILNEEGIMRFDKRRFIIVLTIIAGVILTASLNLAPIAISTLAGVCLLVLTGCLNMKEVYRSVQWPIVFLMAGALSLGVAMDRSGLAAYAAKLIVSELQGWGPFVILSVFYLMTSLLTEVMSNTATAALVAPLAIATALQLNVSPIPFLMATMFAASASFMTPIGYQCNTMVFSAGGYKFTDFTRVGVWLNLIFWILATLLIPVFFPF